MSLIQKRFFFIPILLALGLMIYWPALSFDFVSLDDDELILENKLIQTCDWDHLKQTFGTHQMGHYLPITTLSYMAQYALLKDNALSYHLFSIILHLINGLLVLLWLKKLGLEDQTCWIIAGIFMVHPMNLESVAWISARSNLLFSLFYLSALYCYSAYKGLKQQVFTCLFFVLSCLSKSSAVTLPLALIWIDFYKEGNMRWNFIYKKAHFFVISIIVGLVAIYFSKEFGTLNTQTTFSWTQKPFLSTYALLFYLLKYIYPNHLSALHFFPKFSSTLPYNYYLSLPLLIFLLLIAYRWVKNRLVWLGLAWFLIHIFLNLQWITIGKVFAAERYAYMSYLGLCMALVTLIPKKQGAIIGFGLILIFAIISHTQIQHWSNSNTLYSQVINEYPEHGYGYYGKGIYFKDQNQNDSALSYFSRAIELESHFPNAYLNRANVYVMKGQINQAIEDYNAVINQNPKYKEAYFNLGYLYYMTQDYNASLQNLETSSKLGIQGPYIQLLMADNALNLGLKPLACQYYGRYLNLGGKKISQINYCD